MLRGNAPTKVDGKGRLKIPNIFRAFLEKEFGVDLFVTSVTGEYVRIYPLSVWSDIERRLAQVPSTDPSKIKYLDRVNFYGQIAQLDAQGRVVIQPRLRESAAMQGDVDVFGLYNYLELWNHERFIRRLEQQPFTDEDGRVLSGFGI